MVGGRAMTTVVRSFTSGVRDLVWYTLRSGRWWVPLLLIVLALVVALAAAAQTVVPTAVYTLF